ncbi:unnamed protein product [Fusarium graminearum]|uniref:Uncharacterized protein n=1 Tax=Gibberella zeae TaxID=5518 RepID=A0A9N8X063_GIBZA|nr:unnamed protein product [Fusarium graminearum]
MRFNRTTFLNTFPPHQTSLHPQYANNPSKSKLLGTSFWSDSAVFILLTEALQIIAPEMNETQDSTELDSLHPPFSTSDLSISKGAQNNTMGSLPRYRDELTLTIQPPTDPKTLAQDFVPFLTQFGSWEGGPYVHPRLLSFKNLKAKANWIPSLPQGDGEARDAICNFYQAPKGGAKCWIALCSTETRQGKHVVVYDPDPCDMKDKARDRNGRVRASAVLKQAQWGLVEYIRQNKSSKVRVWYSTDASSAGQNKCMAYSLDKVVEWARMEDDVCHGYTDRRLRHCIELKGWKTMTAGQAEDECALQRTIRLRLIPPPTDPQIQSEQLIPFVSQFQNWANAPYVHPHPLSFRNAKAKTNWEASLPDAECRDTVQDFFRAKKGGKRCWIAFCSTERVNSIKEKEWDDEPWHCYAIAVIQDETRGKRLVIFDPDPDGAVSSRRGRDQLRISRVLRGLQSAIWNFMRENKCKDVHVWYSTDRSCEG